MEIISHQRIPCNSDKGMESLIEQTAKKTGKVIHGFETFPYQMALYDSIPYKKQAEAFMKMVDDVTLLDRQHNELMAKYRKQDIDGIWRLAVAESGEGFSDMDILVYNRSAKWMPLMEEAMKEGVAFFAVDAVHLAGERGLLNLLQQAGYTVRPMQHRPYLQ
ncbi:MAG: TraB/GumN family protein [Flavihumibacter sp.]